ncbi:hypothetical protein [Sphingobacterium thalpophilum]|uniref:hypothetical protein n=1 Tax=Sphingobacterium thalpophilum TaxID=259 RepID=UPI0024A63E8F|nr:hypothetical protein [Sphingobacterium thalpophilum]
MKRYLVFVALLGLGFSACKKEEATKPKDETILVDGEEYDKEFVYTTVAKILAQPKDSIYYNPNTHTLNIDYLNFSMNMDKFGPDLWYAKTGKHEK